MTTLEAIQEDAEGNVIGAFTSEGYLALPTPFPRAELAGRARALATQFGVTIPAEIQSKLPPDPGPA